MGECGHVVQPLEGIGATAARYSSFAPLFMMYSHCRGPGRTRAWYSSFASFFFPVEVETFWGTRVYNPPGALVLHFYVPSSLRGKPEWRACRHLRVTGTVRS